jgi:hypothetical protein
MTEDQDYECPFCITSWICDGPHISSKKDMDNYLEYTKYTREYYLLVTLDEIKRYSRETGLDLSALSDRIKKIIEGRQI